MATKKPSEKTLDRAGKLTETKIRSAMAKTTNAQWPKGNAAKAAEALGVPRPSLLYHLRKLGMRPPAGPPKTIAKKPVKAVKTTAKKTAKKAR